MISLLNLAAARLVVFESGPETKFVVISIETAAPTECIVDTGRHRLKRTR